jgi:hypothetical protein
VVAFWVTCFECVVDLIKVLDCLCWLMVCLSPFGCRFDIVKGIVELWWFLFWFLHVELVKF